MGIKERLSRIERELSSGDESRTKITVNVHGPEEPKRTRDPEGIPTLTPDERTAVIEGETLCFVYSEEPRHVAFKPNGRGGVAVST